MRGRVGLAVCATALLLAAVAGAKTTLRHVPAVATRAVLPPGVTPRRYDLQITPNAAAGVFSGRVAIDLTIDAPTRTITLNTADLTFSRAGLSGEAAPPRVAFDPLRQTATLTFAHVLPLGRRTLTIDYAGRINRHAAGLFSLDYDAPASVGGGRKRALFTQFENSDARRFTPSWDEPNKKAVFALTVTVPADLMAVSNMPIAATTPLVGGLKRVRFAPSAKRSSYLLFFGLGDFERIHRDVGGVDVGVIVKRGAGEQGRYALDAAATILPYYNTYFGMKYPLPKLDLIAGSGESQFFGAMENWGAIFFFDRDLLVDPALSTEEDRQNVYVVVAHEMAHQWFGDLVTMDWWDDLWLNEGFASWMENKAVDHFHPEWKLWLQAAASKEAAMRLDARRGTHPVITPIHDVLQAQQAFDTITYDKGEAVIRMLEAYVGEDAWRGGVRRYIARHAYANSVTDDLWREVDAVSPRKITDIAHDFTRQSGVPLVRAAIGCAGDRADGGASLVRGGFSVDGSSAGESWRIPVKVAAWDHNYPVKDLLTTAPITVVIEHPRTEVKLNCAGPVLVNAGQAGYFRTLYKYIEPLKANFGSFPAADQLGLLNDTAALGAAGDEPYADVLDLISAVPAGLDPVVGAALVARLTAVDALYGETASSRRDAWRARARTELEPVLKRLGWRARSDEAPNVATLRAAVIAALGRFDDPPVVAEARRRFDAYLSDRTRVDPAERRSLLDLVALNADPATWERLHTLARSAPSALEKSEAYVRLGTVRDPILARRALDLALTSEPETTTSPSLIRAVAREHPTLALDFAIAHAATIEARLEPDSRSQYVPRIASSAVDLAAIGRLDAYAAAHIPASAQGEVVKARSAIKDAASVRARVAPQVDAWIAAQP